MLPKRSQVGVSSLSEYTRLYAILSRLASSLAERCWQSLGRRTSQFIAMSLWQFPINGCAYCMSSTFLWNYCYIAKSIAESEL